MNYNKVTCYYLKKIIITAASKLPQKPINKKKETDKYK